MIFFGFITAVASGVALPAHMLLFGRVINSFVFHQTVTAETDGLSVSGAIQELADMMNVSCSQELFLNNSAMLGARMNASQTLLCNQTDSLDNVLPFVCDPGAELQSQLLLFSYYYIALATAVLIALFVATIFWNVSAYRQTRRIRLNFYHSILHQDIGWFDVNKANELSTRLSE